MAAAQCGTRHQVHVAVRGSAHHAKFETLLCRSAFNESACVRRVVCCVVWWDDMYGVVCVCVLVRGVW